MSSNTLQNNYQSSGSNFNGSTCSSNWESALRDNGETATKSYLSHYLWPILNTYSYNCFCSGSAHPNKIAICEIVTSMKFSIQEYSARFFNATFENGMIPHIYGFLRELATRLDSVVDCPVCKHSCPDQVTVNNLLQEMLTPLPACLPNDPPKLIRDFNNLRQLLHSFDASSKNGKRIIKKIIKELPSNDVGVFMHLYKSDIIRIKYSRIIRLLEELKVDCGVTTFESSRVSQFLEKVVMAVDKLLIPGLTPMPIPTNKAEFFRLWSSKQFDSRDPSTLLPPARMYRSYNCPSNNDIWFFMHSQDLLHMSALEFWRVHSPFYSDLLELIVGTLHTNYPDTVADVYQKFSLDDPPDCPYSDIWSDRSDHWNLVKRWDLSVVPTNDSLVYPNDTFKTLYANTLSDFCALAERTEKERTSNYITALAQLSIRIIFMEKWMVSDIQTAVKYFQDHQYVVRHYNLRTVANEDYEPTIDMDDSQDLDNNDIKEMLTNIVEITARENGEEDEDYSRYPPKNTLCDYVDSLIASIHNPLYPLYPLYPLLKKVEQNL